MKASDMNRRDFSRLTIAALGGALAGTSGAAFGQDDPKNRSRRRRTTDRPPVSDKTTGDDDAKTRNTKKKAKKPPEYHLCRGLNSCKGNGVDRTNDCAGMGQCATVKHHYCAEENACRRSEGHCGIKLPVKGLPDDCKMRADSAIPLFEDIWAKARKEFEAKRKGQKIGPAPKTRIAQAWEKKKAELEREQKERDEIARKKKAKGKKKKIPRRPVRAPKEKPLATKRKVKKKK